MKHANMLFCASTFSYISVQTSN